MISRKQFYKIIAAALSAILLPTVVLLACKSWRGVTETVKTPTPKDYSDSPEERWREVLPIYAAWNGFDEHCTFHFDKQGIIEEGNPPPRPQATDGETVLLPEEDPPGGRTFWFRGLSPGDAVITFTTKKHSGKVVYVRQYAIRVHPGLRLDLLHEEHTDFRKNESRYSE
jgi:hypothetical protein